MSKSNRPIIRNSALFLAGIAALFTTALVVYVLAIWLGFFGPVPSKDELGEIQNFQASEIYSADDKLLGTYYIQNRTEITLDEVNPVYIDALLAIEDIRFYEHNGIDQRAMARVLFRSILLGQDAGGGSTLTQQLAKNLYPREKDGWFFLVADKIREMIIATRLESVYDKDRILELYLNTVSFGEEVYGIEMASLRFFNKRPADLDLHEAATLAGMLKATSRYNPYRNPETAVVRRNTVLLQMQKYGMISEEQAMSTIDLPVGTNYNRISVSKGPAPYFREHLRKELAQLFNDKEALDGKTYNLYTDGLIIHTTIDSRVQQAAEQAVETHLQSLQTSLNTQLNSNPVFRDNDDPSILRAWQQSDHYRDLISEGLSDEEIETILHTPVQTQIFTWEGYETIKISPYDSMRHYLSFLNSGFLALNPQTSQVIAWVGGINHEHYKYDHVKSRRQTGSSFKPFVYATAFEYGREPCHYQRNMLTSYEQYERWTPRNISNEYGGRFSLQAALAQSINTIAVDVLMQTGIDRVQETAKNIGIHSPIPAEPSIALGTSEASLLEMVMAYSTFLNPDRPKTPQTIAEIYNSNGKLIYTFSPDSATGETEQSTDISQPTETISDETAAAMVRILSKVVNEGTGSRLRTQFGVTHALAGKTGTTQNYTDGWFIGMTPDLVFGSWVGGLSPRVRFTSTLGYASQTALPVVGHFLTNLRNNSELPAQRSQFYPHQINSTFDFSCEDNRDDRFQDRVRDFFTGRDAEEPKVVDTEEEKRGIFGRIKRIFKKDN